MDWTIFSSAFPAFQLLLLVCFAVCAVLSFLFRLQAGRLIGAADRGTKTAGEVEKDVNIWRGRAVRLAVGAVFFLVLCFALGVLARLTQ